MTKASKIPGRLAAMMFILLSVCHSIHAQDQVKDQGVTNAAEKARQSLRGQLNTIHQVGQDSTFPRENQNNVADLVQSIKKKQDESKKRLEVLSGEIDSLLKEIESLADKKSKAENSGKVGSSTDSKNLSTNNQTPGKTNQVPTGSDNKSTLPDMKSLIESPVDELGLANNLFASENYDMAAKIYKRLSASDLSLADQSWVKYQLGLCYLKTGLFTESEKNLREVANLKSETVSTSMSKWWLDQMNRRKKIRSELQDIDSLLKGFKQDDQDVTVEAKDNE